MKPFCYRRLLSSAFLASAVSAYAHPGHDGHELTWDLGHLAVHPLATLGCLAVFGGAGWLGWRAVKAAVARRRGDVVRDRER